MRIDVLELSESWHLNELQQMRLTEMAESWPAETEEMHRDGTLREYLDSWMRLAEDYLACLMDPSKPGSAWQAAGATTDLRETDPEEWTRRSRMVQPMAEEMLVRTLVLEPLVPTQE